ncbi:MAG: hypothetical protein CM15mV24_2030 [Bellamyvirus sp.]|nr:MAG: hypothetical protein CM15mV24_2030 [Bellamyvirus sp.]
MSRTRDTANMASAAGTFTGSIVSVAATFSGNVSVGGTLTYEDVTNIDSTGIVTARTGVQLGANSATSIVALEAATATTSSTDEVNIDTFSASIYRSCNIKFRLQEVHCIISLH